MEEISASKVAYFGSTSSIVLVKEDKKAGRDKREHKSFKKLPKYDDYTPLNASREAILQEVCIINLLRLPPRGHTPKDADLTLHCWYHRNQGHYMEECMALKNTIEGLIQ